MVNEGNSCLLFTCLLLLTIGVVIFCLFLAATEDDGVCGNSFVVIVVVFSLPLMLLLDGFRPALLVFGVDEIDVVGVALADVVGVVVDFLLHELFRCEVGVVVAKLEEEEEDEEDEEETTTTFVLESVKISGFSSF